MTVHQNLIADLESVISHGSPRRRADALRNITDLFIDSAAGCSDEQVALFDDVIVRLASEIESSARVLLAQRLATITNAPRKTISTLAFDDEIDVARPVLVHSEVLDHDALIRNARTKSPAHLLAISGRKTLPESLTEVLVERGDEAVVLSTVGNAGARFSETGFTILVRRSDGNDRIAVSVGTRQEMPRHLFLKLLAQASHTVRAKLEAANPQAIGEIRRVVDEVSTNIQNRTISESYDYTAARIEVERLQRERRLDEGRIGEFAAAGNFELVVAALALTAGVPTDFAERAMVQERTELLLILCKAVGLSWAATKSVLQLRNRGLAVLPQELEQCLASFERLKTATAQQVVRFHRAPTRTAS